MTLRFKVEEIDCANCAAKMERAIGKLPGVEKATLSFMTGMLTVETEREDLKDEVTALIRKREPDWRVKAL